MDIYNQDHKQEAILTSSASFCKHVQTWKDSQESSNLTNKNGKLIILLCLPLFPFNTLMTLITELKSFSLKLDLPTLLPFQLPRLPKYVTNEIGSPWEFQPIAFAYLL